MIAICRICKPINFQISRAVFPTSCHQSKRKMELGFGILNSLFGGVGQTVSRLLSGNSRPQQQFTVSVEGNIGSGKTCLLQHFENCPHAEVYTEPVSKWRDIEGHNALDAMYKDPTRWSMTLQTYVQLTMLEQHTNPQTMPVKLMERSLYSAKYCFVENLYQTKCMPEMEYLILTKWFDWITQNQDTHLDLIVYLRTDPETVYERIQQRCRKEEATIPMEYLLRLHQLHEDWLIHRTSFSLPAPVLVLDANKGRVDMMAQYEEYSSRILCGHS